MIDFDLSLITIGLIALSYVELRLQEAWISDSIKRYLFSLIAIVLSNIVITGAIIVALFGSSLGISVIVLLLASLGFPLFSGLFRLPKISEQQSIRSEAATIRRNRQ